MESKILLDITCSKDTLINELIHIVPPIIVPKRIEGEGTKQERRQEQQQDQDHEDNKQDEHLKVLCIVLTHSGNHYTRIPTIQSTWGAKCHTLLLSSNETNHELNVYDYTIHGASTYSSSKRGDDDHDHHREVGVPGRAGTTSGSNTTAADIIVVKNRIGDGPSSIYERLAMTLKYVATPRESSNSITSNTSNAANASNSNLSILDQHDYVLITEDDTFVIVENLISFLRQKEAEEAEEEAQEDRRRRSSTTTSSSKKSKYKMYGRIIHWPNKLKQYTKYPWFQSKTNTYFKQEFINKFGGRDEYFFTYVYGGSGIILNREIVSKFVKSYEYTITAATTTTTIPTYSVQQQNNDDQDRSRLVLRGPIYWYDRGLCVSLMNILPYGWKPQSTIDYYDYDDESSSHRSDGGGLERVHIQSPLVTWINPDWLPYSIVGLNVSSFLASTNHYQGHKDSNNKCCISPTSFIFHQVDTSYIMKLLYYQLYHCPKASFPPVPRT